MIFMAAPYEYVKVKYDDASLRELMVYLLFKKGKTIETAEISKVLNYVQGDFSLLHIIVNYLIKFSLFETVSSSIDAMIQMDKAHLYRFYFHEIIGFTVVDTEKGELGPVTDVLEYPTQAILQVMKGKKEILIPILDQVIQNVDRDNKILTITAPEGLIDMYLQ